MIREVEKNGIIIKYELVRKRVKNINMRIKPDLTVSVSASPRVPLKYIDDFVLKKSDFILDAIDGYKSKEKLKPLYTAEEFSELIVRYYNEVYNSFREYNIPYPKLKIKKMSSRWGSCNYVKGIIALSVNLIYCTEEQIYYVIVHEFSHFLVHNHSREFYDIVSKFCPDYKRIRREMNQMVIK